VLIRKRLHSCFSGTFRFNSSNQVGKSLPVALVRDWIFMSFRQLVSQVILGQSDYFTGTRC
jgi:hypothetical protein